MAEGLLEGIVGGDDDKPETEAPEAPVSAEAFAAAVAAIASRQDPGVARKTEIFLEQQASKAAECAGNCLQRLRPRFVELAGVAGHVQFRCRSLIRFRYVHVRSWADHRWDCRGHA